MTRRRSSLSHATSYSEIAEFWDEHDVADCWDQTSPEEFEVSYQIEVTYFALKNTLAARVTDIARRREVSEETLLNAWVRDRLLEEMADLEVYGL